MNLKEIVDAGVAMQELSELLQPENGEHRWQSLQNWLKKNPEWKQRLNEFLKSTPDQGIALLCKHLNINYSILSLLDRDGSVRATAKDAIIQLQTLYKERAEMSQVKKPARLKKKPKKPPQGEWEHPAA